MANYELCKYYLDKNEEIIDCVGEYTDLDCISKSLVLLDMIISSIHSGDLNLAASVKFYESYRSINNLYNNSVVDRDDFEKISLQLLDQIITDMQTYVKYKDEQMKKGE